MASPTNLVRGRVTAHGFAAARFTDPAALVGAFGAMQGQDYNASLWAVGSRVIGATRSSIEAAVSAGSIVRTHALRNTIHLVAASDVRWILSLTADRQLARAASRYRELGLDAKTFLASEAIMARVLAEKHHTRRELSAALSAGGVNIDGQRFVHLVHHAELAGVLISGEVRDRQTTFALFDERIPAATIPPRDEALAELARRYFTLRGPATLDDFVWWSGLTIAEARAAMGSIELAAYEEDPVASGDRVTLLPTFDEYTVAYKDRRALSDRLDGFGLLGPVVVFEGRAIATWRRDGDCVTITPVDTMPPDDELDAAVARYGRFRAR